VKKVDTLSISGYLLIVYQPSAATPKYLLMGNSPSSISRCGASPFRRSTGSLGLSKNELDLRSKSSGLYENCKWEQRQIRRAIGDGKLAARLNGAESRERDCDQECPICFLHYTQINMVQCCNATICTECYLQVQEPPKSQNPPSPCPFCNHSKIVVTVAKKLDGNDVAKRDEEEQQVIEATIRARSNSVSSVHSQGSATPMTPDERQNLEREMKSQSSHPIMTQIRRQEDERRDMHDREYNRRSGERYSMFQREFLMRRRMEALNNMDDDETSSINRRALSASQLGRSGNGGLNDLFLIEAALLLSMQNDRASSTSSRSVDAPTSGSTTTNASASAEDNSNNDSAVRRNPLLRALMLQRSRENEEENSYNMRRTPWDYNDPNEDPLVRSGFLGEGFPAYSDDDQMAMAIAMSLREEEERNRSQRSLREVQENERRALDEESSEEIVFSNVVVNSDDERNQDDDDNDDNNDDDDATGNSTHTDGELQQGHSPQDPHAQDPNNDGQDEDREAVPAGDSAILRTT